MLSSRCATDGLTAHNELATIPAAVRLGAFPLDADIEYFRHLQEFVDIIAGGPRPFADLMRNDAQVFLEALVRGARS